MKKILFLISVFVILVSFNCNAVESNGTYFSLFSESGYDYNTKIGQYLTEEDFNEILRILLKSEKDYDAGENGYVMGFEVLNAFEDMGLDTSVIENREKFSNWAITFNLFLDTLDYYFKEIVTLNNLKTEKGIMAESDKGGIITYGYGNVINTEIIPTRSPARVNMIFKEDKLIEVIEVSDQYIPLYKFGKLEEITGNFFMYGDDMIYIKKDNKISRYFCNNPPYFLGNKNSGLSVINQVLNNKEIVLYTGSYKKYIDMALIFKEI